MKKVVILLLVLTFMLTACANNIPANTASAEGDFYSDENEPGLEYEIDDDAEPQIWRDEGVLYDDPDEGVYYEDYDDSNDDGWYEYSAEPDSTQPPAQDGWDGEDPELPPEKLDDSELPDAIAEGAMYVARTTVGTIVIHDTGYVFRLIDGEVVHVWDYDVEADNVIFDVEDRYSTTYSRWWGYVGNSLVYFTDDEMMIYVQNCAEFNWNGANMYCYHIENGTLYAASPNNDTPILDGVIEIYTKEGYTFARCLNGTYVINASPYTISQHTQFFNYEHRIPYIYLGTDDWYNYYMELDPRTTGKSALESAADFDKKYGTDLTVWGNPTYEFETFDLVRTAGKPLREVYDLYDVAEYRNDREFRVPGITLGDTDLTGSITYTFSERDEPSRMVWESYLITDEAFQSMLRYAAAHGAELNHYTKSGVTEYAFVTDGGFNMHIRYDQASSEDMHLMVWVDY